MASIRVFTMADIGDTTPGVRRPFEPGHAEDLHGREEDLRDRERAMHEREQRFTDFAENATVGLHQVGPDGTILWANRAELQMLG